MMKNLCSSNRVTFFCLYEHPSAADYHLFEFTTDIDKQQKYMTFACFHFFKIATCFKI